jgi:AcrR family transcriptional regulator
VALSPDDVGAFREQLVAVATRRFAEQGYAGVTLRTLAAELGCSAMTPYRYFRNKAEIFAAVRTAAFARFAAAQEDAARVRDPLERLRALGLAYLAFARADADGYRLMFELTQPTDTALSELDEQALRAWTPLREATARAIETGALVGDPDRLAHVFWASLHGAVALHLAGKLTLGCDLETLTTAIMDTLVCGAAAPPHRPRPRPRGNPRGNPRRNP